ncbi:MAG: hypothetical protein ACXQT5_05355 [Candidatus Syntropharchaeia archaeon]
MQLTIIYAVGYPLIENIKMESHFRNMEQAFLTLEEEFGSAVKNGNTISISKNAGLILTVHNISLEVE